jgi:hypothetical protein
MARFLELATLSRGSRITEARKAQKSQSGRVEGTVIEVARRSLLTNTRTTETALRLIIGALALALVSALAQPARADSKDQFKNGCEAGGGSYGENANGVFCNSSGGVHIQCDGKVQNCTASSGANGKVKHIRPTIGALRSYLASGKSSRGYRDPAKVKHFNAKALYGRSTGPTNPNGPDLPGKNNGSFARPEYHAMQRH